MVDTGGFENVFLKGKQPSTEEIEEMCVAVSKLRVKGLTFSECSEYLKVGKRTIERHYPRWAAKELDKDKANWQAYVKEFVETQKDIIKQAELSGDRKLRERANCNLFDRLQAGGIIPTVADKVEHSGNVTVGTEQVRKLIRGE